MATVVCEGDSCRRVGPEEAGKAGASPAAPAASAALSLLGTTLKGHGGAQVPVASVTGKNKVIAFYFSAHWCPPCRHFTPHLADIYKKFKASHARKDDWEVVFVSSDRDEAAFSEYFETMPWLALPFEQRDAKAELSKLFKVRGIPTLVIVDGETGEVITTNGREAVGDDEECANFPWRPKTFAQIIEGAVLEEPGAEGKTVPAAERLAGKVTLLYFSASWCPPCRRFTPKLVDVVKALRDAGKAVEAVLVSGDREAGAAKEYHSHMTWPMLPFTDRQRAADLNMLFEVEGIPTLVVLDESFKPITTEGVGAVLSDPEAKRFPWAPQPLEALAPYTAPRINGGKVLLLVVDEAEDALAEAFAADTLGALAKATVAAHGQEWAFLWAKRGNELAQSVLGFAGLVKSEEDEPPKGHVALLLDVPGSQSVWDLGKAGVAITAQGLSGVIADFTAGRLGPGKKLGEDDDEEEEEEE